MIDRTERQSVAQTLAGLRGRFIADQRGNILPLFAIVLPLLLFTLGAAVDYTSAARRQETIDGIADAAALSATQPTMLSSATSCYPNQSASTCAVVVAQVTNVFNQQSALVEGVSGTSLNSVTITDAYTSGTSGPFTRTVAVSWSSNSGNLFSGVLGWAGIPISGNATAVNQPAPETHFFMYIDESPSMYFPSTPAGVTTMVDATPLNMGHSQSTGVPVGGCALGCHEASNGGSVYDKLFNPSNVTCATGAVAPFTAGTTYFGCVAVSGTSHTVAVSSGVSGGGTSPEILPIGQTNAKDSSGTTWSCAATSSQPSGPSTSYNQSTTYTPSAFKTYFGAEDNYALARCLAIPLRIDLVNAAVEDLLTQAPITASDNRTTYAVDIYTIDQTFNSSGSPSASLGTASVYTLLSGGVPTSGGTALAGASPNPNVVEAQVSQSAPQIIYQWNDSAGSGTSIANGGSIDTDMTTEFGNAATAFAKVTPLISWGNGTLSTNANVSNASSNSDADSPIDIGLQWFANNLPSAGTGLADGAPQEVLFMVSDGVNDVLSGGNLPKIGTSYYACNPSVSALMNSQTETADQPRPSTGGTNTSHAIGYDYNRPVFCAGTTMDTAVSPNVNVCTAIKNKGVEIAYLYLQYNPLDPDPSYYEAVEPFQYPTLTGDADNLSSNALLAGNYDYYDQIAAAAATCASSQILEFTVTQDSDIEPAMEQLFQEATQQAYLSR